MFCLCIVVAVFVVLAEFGHLVDRLASTEPRFALEHASSRWREGDGTQMESLVLRIVTSSSVRTAALARHQNKVRFADGNTGPQPLCCSARGKDLAQILLKPRSEPLATSTSFTYGKFCYSALN